ncbi:hypothetical protein J3E71DRAFT_390625 [Bipolaris maydis]|nr:hypothetical protein J3E71DRAFT_390625 [Bipolaris maydis]
MLGSCVNKTDCLCTYNHFTIERDASIVFRAQGYRLRLSSQGLDAIENALGPEDFQKFYDKCGKTGGAGFAAIDPLTGETLTGRTATYGKIVGISRGDMRTLFIEGLEHNIRWSHHIVGYETTDDGVRLVFADGSKSEEGSMLVGGEGVKSAVAGQLSNGAIKVYDLGSRRIHGQAPTAAFKGLGEGVFVISDTDSQPNGGKVFLITNFGWTMGGSPGVIDAPNDNYTITGPPAAKIAKSLISHCHARAEAAFWKITCSSPDGVPTWPNEPLMTVIGDAVHAMTPAGGNEAWERGDGDSWTGVTVAYEKEMGVYATEAVQASYGSAITQFGVNLDLEHTPTINKYVAPN